MIGTWTDPGPNRFETWRVNADGSGRTRLPIPEGDLVLDASRDGTWLATRTMGGDPRHRGRLTLVHPDGTGARYLTEGSAKDDRFSIFKIAPDGRSVAYAEITTVDKVRHAELFIVDIDGRHRRRIPTHFEPGTTVNVCWSPDGSRLALNIIDGENKQGSIVLVDLDGPNYPLPQAPAAARAMEPHGLRLDDARPGHPPRGQSTSRRTAKTLRGRYQALLQENANAGRIYGQAIRKAKTAEERMRAYEEKFPRPRAYAGRFLQIAESAPGPVGRRCAGLDRAARRRRARVRPRDRAARRDHAAKHERRSPGGEQPDRQDFADGRAALPRGHRQEPGPVHPGDTLACGWGNTSGINPRRSGASGRTRQIAGRLEAMFLEEGGDKESFERFRSRDPDALMKQAEAAFERVVKEFGDVPGGRGEPLGQEARSELNEIRNLVPGKPAPEVTGADVDGHPIKLSDYRGRVVLISFWGQQWGSLRRQVPSDRVLAARMKDRPFVLLGVNDDGKELLRALIKKEGITWPTLWDRGGDANTPGPIARQFNIQVRPSHYLIDHRGIIRHKFIGTAGVGKLDAAIDELVAAAERDPDATKP